MDGALPCPPRSTDAGRERLALIPQQLRNALSGQQRLERLCQFGVAIVDVDRARLVAGVLQYQARDGRVAVEIDAQALYEPALLGDRLGNEVALADGLVGEKSGVAASGCGSPISMRPNSPTARSARTGAGSRLG